MFLLGRLGPSKHEVSDLENPSSDFPLVVPVESLLVASGADDGHLAGLLEQVDCVLLSLHSSVAVESFTLGAPWSRSEGSTASAP